eukprot:CAMPEP_0197896664 /NCGR_PEP_ID=MMETSP1439-20131203/40482_1 /TAXON_ID=66791 /ORGANISM="Gonyaulax spinifera, Strain CCMP409" /LENGTH=37 /DNA_ID= /DNA_START= /DNA_END= /DNA_ORIENTATION=
MAAKDIKAWLEETKAKLPKSRDLTNGEETAQVLKLAS